jgi:nitroreductase
MNPMIQKQLNHRSIRVFKDQPFPQDDYETLMEVARRTATSSGLQAASIIRISDPVLKKQIADLCHQDYIGRIPLLLIFVVDQYRNNEIALEQGIVSDGAAGMDSFFQSFTDASIMAQNVVNAAEALDYGTFYIGSIHNDPSAMCALLKLPNLVFPVVGVGIGIPAQEPALKPRMDNALRVFENRYVCFDDTISRLKEYDAQMQTYYDLRDTNRRLDSFTLQVAKRINAHNPTRQELLNVVRDQGFIFRLK